MNFVRPQGRYVYQHSGCNGDKVTWTGVSWKATHAGRHLGHPARAHRRLGRRPSAPGRRSSPRSPAAVRPQVGDPGPAQPGQVSLQVEFTLKNTTKDTAPVLQEYGVSFGCPSGVPL